MLLKTFRKSLVTEKVASAERLRPAASVTHSAMGFALLRGARETPGGEGK